MKAITLKNYYLIFAITLCTYSVAASPLAQHSMPGENEYVHAKEEHRKPEIMAEDPDPYHITNEYKQDQQQPQASQPGQQIPLWNLFRPEDYVRAHKYLGIYGYQPPTPIIIPYPVMISPELYWNQFQNYEEFDDPMSRANGRRPSSYRNSPIYYLRLPPTPYVFVPGLGYTSQPPTFTPNFSPMVPYNPLPTLPVQPAISSVYNLPLNFLANGKPTGIYQLDPTGMQSQYPQYFPTRPYRPPYLSQNLQYIPESSRPQYLPQPTYVQDSKITHLKRPFLFNGRPEEIYFLQNTYNPMYQSPIPGYY